MHAALMRMTEGLVVAASMLVCGPLAAMEWSVPAGQGSLQEFIEKAQAGDLLRLAPGNHAGPVVIDKPLTLAGAGAARIVGNGTGSVVTVTAPDVTP